MNVSPVEKITQHIWRHAEKTISFQFYAVLDAARNDAIYQTLAQTDNLCTSLFRGEKAEELATVAPYLVMLNKHDPLTNWLLTYGWGQSWGILLGSSAPFNEIKHLLQSMFMAYNEDGKPIFFRYYDPRVFRLFIPTCTSPELRDVFGPVDIFVCEDESPGTLLEFTLSSGQLNRRTVEL